MSIVCDPGKLLAASRCIPCLTPRQRLAAAASNFCKTAVVGLKGMQGGLVQLSGFNFVPGATGVTAVAVWNGPPANATATELWTSPDNITYALASTNPAPSVGASVGAPAVGSFTWAKARYISATAQGAFCAAQEVSGRVCDWAKRVVANGGANPTLTERTAANTFDLALVSASLDSQMKYVLIYAPSSLVGARTPLYKVVGADPAINNGFAAGDLSINGLHNAAGNYLDIGATVAAIFASASNAGVSLYAFTGGVEGSPIYDTGTFDNVSNQCTLRVNNAGGNTVCCMFASANQLTVASPGAGFYSMNRVAAADFRLFWGNSTNPLAQQGATLAGANGALHAVNPIIPGISVNGGPSAWSNHTHSAALFHNGLTLVQATNLFNAVQAYRVGIGGGSV